MLTLFEICSVLGVPPAAEDAVFSGICIDSRKVKPGDLFVAIQGERLNGHEFIPQAISAGATGILSSDHSKEPDGITIEVPDTLQALAALATHHRQRLDCATVALTGSNGKTSVKEMIAAILPKPSHATPGNLNNHIGVPLSVFQLTSEHQYAVFELGANHIGEISHTVKIVKPQVTLINNIAPAHIGEFGSIEGVAKAKGEIYAGLDAGGTAIVNDDDEFSHFWDPLFAHKNVLRFSRTKPADFYARNISLNERGCAEFILVTPKDEITIQLNVPGAHNVSNALAAAASTYALGISLNEIAAGLTRFSGVPGRMTILSGKNQSIVIDDTYNANLRSVLTALDVLASHKGSRIFVFGDMGDLGSWAKEHHQEVGIAARTHGIERLMTCGINSELTTQAFGSEAEHYPSQAALVADLLAELNKDTTILVKGSRSAAMEKIVHQLVG